MRIGTGEEERLASKVQEKVDEIGTYAAREFPLISTCTVDCKTGPDGRARERDRDREPEGLPAAHIAASS